MYQLNRTQFLTSPIHFDGSKENPLIIGNYSDSFNMIIGTKNTDINWFDNPYISANVYEIENGFKLKMSEVAKLRECSKDDLTKFMPDDTASYYENSLCFKDPQNIDMWNNWFDDDYKNYMIAITACDQDTYKGTCKTL